MPFTFVQGVSNDSSSPATFSGVVAGALLVVWFKWESTTAPTAATDTAGDTWFLAPRINHSNGDLHGVYAYCIGASAGSHIVTLSPNPAAFPRTRGAEFSFSGGTPTVVGPQSNQAAASLVTSGNLTVSGSDILALGGNGEYQGIALLSHQINGVAASVAATGDYVDLWYRIISAGYTGAATVDQGVIADYVCSQIAFVIGGSGGAAGAFPFRPQPMAHMILR